MSINLYVSVFSTTEAYAKKGNNAFTVKMMMGIIELRETHK